MPETMDEKQVQQQPSPGGKPAAKPEVFRLLARVWVVLMGLSWAGTLTFLLTHVSFLGKPSVRVGNVFVSAGALAIGLAVGAALVFLILKKLGGQLTYSRAGLGRAVRLSAFAFIGSIVLFGAYALYMAPTASSLWWKDVAGPWSLMGKGLSLKPVLFPAAGLFLTLMSVVFLVLNRERSADFLIETEGEIKKVSWPARKEYVGSAMIVILVVAVVSMFLHYVDAGLSWLMQKWGVGF